MSAPGSAAAHGQVRIALAAMEQKHRRFVASATALPMSIADGLAFRGVVARNRAVERLRVMLPARPLFEQERAVVYRFLRPRMLPIAAVPADEREGVEVASLVCGRGRGEAVIVDAPYGLFISSHSLCRLWARARPRVNFVKAIEEAHDVLLAAPAKMFDVAHDEKQWVLPTPAHGGGFLCTVRVLNYLGHDAVAYLVANSWIDSSQYYPDQEKQVEAMLHQGDGPRLGDEYLLPVQLRPVAAIVDGRAGLPFDPIPEARTRIARKKIQPLPVGKLENA